VHSLKGLPHDRHPHHRPDRRYRAGADCGQAGARAFAAFKQAFADGILIRVTGDIIALSPPLVLEKKHIDECLES
jgi:beta-alanine--pyruvate transaminase